MSHANGMVQFPDKTIMYFEYNGTSDMTVSVLWDTPKEVRVHWRDDLWNKCTCSHDEPVTLFTDYGSSFYWPGRACRHCRAITEGLQPFDTDVLITDGTPDWVHRKARIAVTWRLIGAGKKLHAFKGDETTYAICGLGGRATDPCDSPDEWPFCKVCVEHYAELRRGLYEH